METGTDYNPERGTFVPGDTRQKISTVFLGTH